MSVFADRGCRLSVITDVGFQRSRTAPPAGLVTGPGWLIGCASGAGETRLLRRMHQRVRIDVLRFTYHVRHHLSGQTVEVFSRDGLLEVFHDGVRVATHACTERDSVPQPAPAGAMVVRKVNGQGPARFETVGTVLALIAQAQDLQKLSTGIANLTSSRITNP